MAAAFPRLADELPTRKSDMADEPIREVELWDLVSAFGRILRERDAARPSSIVYDETPIHVYMARIEARLRERGVVSFSDLFQPEQHKSVVVGLFFAVLELVRHHGVRDRAARAARRNLDSGRTARGWTTLCPGLIQANPLTRPEWRKAAPVRSGCTSPN